MIEIQNLKFKYASSKNFALNGISLKIPKGKYIAIVGHNGSGKTTLSKLLVGLYKPTSGNIIINDTLMSKDNLKKIRSEIGIVFQNPENQFIGASVEDDIAFGLENKQIPREKMKKLIFQYAKKVGLDKHLDKEPQNLSGGQKQRVAIASTIALDPKIIIFDEVTSMLDPKGKDEVLKIIKNIQKNKNKTLISITHNMDEAILADIILVFANGNLIAKGSPKEILKNSKITKIAKISAPFIYKLSSSLNSNIIKPTYKEEELLEALCK